MSLAPSSASEVGKCVVQFAIDDNVHATQGVDDVHKTLKIHARVIVYADAQIVLDGRLDQARTPAWIADLFTVESAVLMRCICQPGI